MDYFGRQVATDKNRQFKMDYSRKYMRYSERLIRVGMKLSSKKHRRAYFFSLSGNPNITIEDVLTHPEVPWNHQALSRNDNITLKDMRDNPQIDWDKYELLSRFEFNSLREFMEGISFIDNSDPISGIILTNVALNKHFTIKIMCDLFEWLKIDNMTQYLNNYDNMTYWLSGHANISMQDVLDHPEIKWAMNEVVTNNYVSVADILKHVKSPGHLSFLRDRSDINAEFMVKNNFHISDSSSNYCMKWCPITMRDIENNPKFKWNFEHLSENPHISLDDIMKNMGKKWSYVGISANPAIELRDIIKAKLSVSARGLAHNPMLNYDDVKKYNIKITPTKLARNRNLSGEQLEEVATRLTECEAWNLSKNYYIFCDATCEQVLKRLRKRKSHVCDVLAAVCLTRAFVDHAVARYIGIN